jgi:hypothetical protein
MFSAKELKLKYAQEEREIESKISRQLPDILENPKSYHWQRDNGWMNSYQHHAPRYSFGGWVIAESWDGNITESAKPASLSYRGRNVPITQEQVNNLLLAIK